MTWAIKQGWRFEPMEVVKETAKMVFYIDNTWNNRESRCDKDKFLDWRGDEQTARALAAKLTSARAEYDRRHKAAHTWYAERQAEILASCDTQPKAGDVQQAPLVSGAVGEAETPKV